MSEELTPREKWYPFERLEVYHLAVRLRTIFKQISALRGVNPDDVAQGDRSTKSSVRNICEAAGEYRPAEKARFYRMALRSATETGGTVRIIEDDIGSHVLFAESHAINYELVAKLTKLASNKQRKQSKPRN